MHILAYIKQYSHIDFNHVSLSIKFLIKQKAMQTAASEDDTEFVDMVEGLTIDGIKPSPGGPFSSLTPSMWPQDILAKLGQPEVNSFELISLKFLLKEKKLNYSLKV